MKPTKGWFCETCGTLAGSAEHLREMHAQLIPICEKPVIRELMIAPGTIEPDALPAGRSGWAAAVGSTYRTRDGESVQITGYTCLLLPNYREPVELFQTIQEDKASVLSEGTPARWTYYNAKGEAFLAFDSANAFTLPVPHLDLVELVKGPAKATA